jgi:hypothetical protein
MDERGRGAPRISAPTLALSLCVQAIAQKEAVVRIHTAFAAAAAALTLVAASAAHAARAQHHYVLPLAAAPGTCTLTVAAGPLWTYSCPTRSGLPVGGASHGAIPGSCTVTSTSGYRWSFTCPSSALLGPSAVVRIDRATVPHGCARVVSDRVLQRVSCGL